MSDNPARETTDSRSFEERIFARFDAFDGRPTTLEEKVDSRLRETRPVWEAMRADLANVKDDLADVKVNLAGVKEDVTKVKGDVKEIKYALKAMHKDMFRVGAEQEELDERVEKLESQSTR